jgi:hypothetical protein
VLLCGGQRCLLSSNPACVRFGIVCSRVISDVCCDSRPCPGESADGIKMPSGKKLRTVRSEANRRVYREIASVCPSESLNSRGSANSLTIRGRFLVESAVSQNSLWLPMARREPVVFDNRVGVTESSVGKKQSGDKSCHPWVRSTEGSGLMRQELRTSRTSLEAAVEQEDSVADVSGMDVFRDA